MYRDTGHSYNLDLLDYQVPYCWYIVVLYLVGRCTWISGNYVQFTGRLKQDIGYLVGRYIWWRL
jgi:hypothetical protein